MGDFNSDSSSVSDFLSLESSSVLSMFDTDTCDSLIAGFEQCNMTAQNILIPQQISTTAKNSGVTDLTPMETYNSVSNDETFQEKSTMASFQGSSSNDKKVTCEVGVNTDRRFNSKIKNFRQPYFKYKNYQNYYYDFKQRYHAHGTHGLYNGGSRKPFMAFKKYRNYNKVDKHPNRWQYHHHHQQQQQQQMPPWEEERIVKGFYFFTQLMKCFTGRF